MLPGDAHIRADSRSKMGDSAWFCGFPRCDVAYFNLFEAVVTVDELRAPVYPKDFDAPICACFGLSYDDVEADVGDGAPTRIHRLPNTATVDALKSGFRYARNQTLVNFMRDYRYVEFRGMGIRDKIIPGMHAHNGTEPALIDSGADATMIPISHLKQAMATN